MNRPTLTSLRVPHRGGPNSERVNLYRNQFLYCLNQLFQIYNQQAQAVNEDIAKSMDHQESYSDSSYHPFPPGEESGNPIQVKLNCETDAMTFEKYHLISMGYKNLRDQIDLLMRSL
jgi:hypothetical protein